MSLIDELDEALALVHERAGRARPTVGLILGSGLGGFADELAHAVAIDYGDIPHFATSMVAGHSGRLVVGDIAGKTCAALKGRAHFYEGHDIARVVFPARLLVRLGCQTLIVTNAAGGIHESFAPGDLVVIRDHLNLLPAHPLRGENDERLGPRFPDLTEAYDATLRQVAHDAARSLGTSLHEGVYAALPGPSYETPAEVRMLRTLGADMTGMSTVPEVIAARHMGARVLGLSCITNLAAGLGGTPLSHDEVTETAARVHKTFTALITRILERL